MKALKCIRESLRHGEVLAVARGVSGETMAKSVELNGDSRVCEDNEDLDCKISEPWEGGPLLPFDGNMVGVNLFLTTSIAVFLPRGIILKHYLTSYSSPKRAYKILSVNICILQLDLVAPVHGDFLNQEQLDLDSMGYPKLPSTMFGSGMILVNSFEDTFGDIRGKGVWKKFSKRANINRNVVALASFNGEKVFFACTSFFIEWNGCTIILTSASLVRNSGDENKIDENLRIEVLLNNQCKEGKLRHCNLHYNVALVSVKDYCALRSSNTLLDWESSFEVAAVGRCFKSDALMATSGNLVSWTGTLDREFLSRSTCKITKAGIGGPLVNLDGDVIGMNLYDTRIGRTPFLLWEDICKILASFETTSEPGDVGNASGARFWKMPMDDKNKFNRFPVPMPRWCHPEEVESDDDDELSFDPESGQLKYGYTRGRKVKLMQTHSCPRLVSQSPYHCWFEMAEVICGLPKSCDMCSILILELFGVFS
ncbi:uncharacterized protein LOC101762774 [Setaria italica]|uniref:uncharacterized protein LOC101762774 n=1 Tax=Setaria italica TaxID=4555 RepID=UPI00064856E4|nr:uncharacterized protein LOC101762774 [Setaria italica]